MAKKGSGVGFGIAALAAATAAGAYFLYGSKHAKHNRKQVKGWALKAKGEVLEQMERANKELREVDYKAIVDTVMKRYRKVKSVNTKEVDALARELKSHWKSIERGMKKSAPKKKAKKAAKKTKKRSG